MSNSENIIANISNEFDNVAKIEKQLFTVKKIQFTSPMPGFDRPDTYGIYKHTGGSCLGAVGKQYDPIQPKHFLETILVSIMDSNLDLDLNTLNYQTYKGDTKVSFNVHLKEFSFKNKVKLQDVTKLSMQFTTSFDGMGSTTIELFSHRLICENGMMIRHKDAQYRFRHTTGGNAKALTYVKGIMQIAEGAVTYQQIAEQANKIKVTQKEVDEFLTKVTGYNVKEYKALNTRSRNILDDINNSIATEFGRTGATAWGMLNGITYYTNHVASANKDRNEFLLFGKGNELNTKAQNAVLQMLN